MALLASGQAVEVATVVPDMAKVIAAHHGVGRQYPPHRLTAAAMDASFVEAVEESSQGSSGRSWALVAGALLRRGGGVGHPLTSGHPVPSNLHGC